MYHKIKLASVFTLLVIISLVFSSGAKASTTSPEGDNVLRLQDGLEHIASGLMA